MFGSVNDEFLLIPKLWRSDCGGGTDTKSSLSSPWADRDRVGSGLIPDPSHTTRTCGFPRSAVESGGLISLQSLMQ